MNRKILFAFILFCPFLKGQTPSCTTATCNASSANESDVINALPSSSNTNSTVTVNIPSGTGVWTSDLVYTIPSGITNLTIHGNSTLTWTGTAGTSSWNYTAADNTIIQDADSSNNSLLTLNTGASSTYVRVTGLTWEENGGATKYSGEIAINGNSRNFRFDHIHITGSGKQDEWVRVGGHVTGVFDHNAVDENPTTTNGDNAFQAFDPVDDTIGLGDGTWLNGTQFGTFLPLYIESNYFKGGAPDDCNWGARFVMRYNTMDSNYVGIQTHGTKSSGGPQRGCNSYEAYNNYFTNTTSTPETSAATGAKGGTALLFNNTMASGSNYNFYEASTDRNGGDTSSNETNNPAGWGYCSTQTPFVAGPNMGLPNGVGSNWDGNQPTIATGYPCLDQLGRGQDTQALNGQPFSPFPPGRLNSVTGTIAWPHQYLEPIYMWNNTIPGATYTNVNSSTGTAQNNRDYYFDQSAQSGSFNGTAGTGYGLHSARPSTCTPGSGGPYSSSPTGSYGVAYFATDDNSGNGELYVCTGTNTWTAVYQPAVYPHPLASGTPVAATPVYSPTAGVYSVTQTVTITSSTPSSTITYCTDTTNTCTPTTTYSTPVSISSTHYLRAFATASGYTQSSTASGQYVINTGTGIDDTATGWDICYIGTCPGGGTPGGIGVPTATSGAGNINNAVPSLDGASMLFSQTTSTSNTNVLWTYKQPTTCDLCTNLETDSHVYLGSNSSQASSFEFDQFVFSTGRNTNFMCGSQCNQVNGLWQFWDSSSGWVNSSLSCSLSYSAWHEIDEKCHTGNGTVTYDSITIDGVVTNLGITHNAATLPSGWTTAVGTQYQIDIGTITGSQTVTENLDEATFTASLVCGDPSQNAPYSGSYSSPPTVLPLNITWTNPTSGCALHYTTDGTAPTCSSTAYPGGGLNISSTTTVRVIACQSGYTSSGVFGGNWNIVVSPPTTTTSKGLKISGMVLQ